MERQDIQNVFKERMASGKRILDDEEMSRITQIQSADILLSGRIYQLGKSIVLFMKLVDVHTLEKLAVARVLWTPEF